MTRAAIMPSHETSASVSRLRAAAACAMLGIAPVTGAVAATDAPVLDLRFDREPAWRSGKMPWPPVARSFEDPGFVLSAGLMSGLRASFATEGGRDAAWASLSNEREAYPNGDAMAVLGIRPMTVSDGVLRITASLMPKRAASTLPSDMKRSILSGAFNTYPFSQTYGRFEIEARVPKGRGLWPAFWLLPVDQSWPPEIDIAEVLGDRTDTAFASIHSRDTIWAARQKDAYHNDTTTDAAHMGADLSKAFHRYAVDWGPRSISFLLDGSVVSTRPTPGDMHAPFYLVVDLAVGDTGSWPGPPDAATTFPATLEIRSVRVWRDVP